MTSFTHCYNKNILPENYNTNSQRGYGDSFHNLQEGMVANTLGHLERKLLNSDENAKEQVNDFCLNSNNYTPCNVNQSNVQKSFVIKEFCDNKSTKVSNLESKLQNLSVSVQEGNGNNISDGYYNILSEKNHSSELGHLRCNNDAQELTFDSLPDDAFITVKQSKPIRNIALFISFNYDLNNNFFQEKCNAHGFHALFHEIQDHINIAPTAKLITDVVVNCWLNNWNITIFIASEPIIPISTVTALLKLLRVDFDKKSLDIVIIWPNVYAKLREWIDEQCSFAKATACIQGLEVSDIVPQIMSYFDNSKCDKEIDGTTTLFDKKTTICYHEFNNSYPAAMRIDDNIWLDVKQYLKSETANLIETNLHDRNIFLVNILRKALYNKFSQHSRFKQMLLSTRITPICFTQETCKCNSRDQTHSNTTHSNTVESKNAVESDKEILKAKFISILEEIRYSFMQGERGRIESEYRNLKCKEKDLFLFE